MTSSPEYAKNGRIIYPIEDSLLFEMPELHGVTLRQVKNADSTKIETSTRSDKMWGRPSG